jgi:hypothetical protein
MGAVSVELRKLHHGASPSRLGRLRNVRAKHARTPNAALLHDGIGDTFGSIEANGIHTSFSLTPLNARTRPRAEINRHRQLN